MARAADDVSKWVAASKRRMTAVMQETAQRVIALSAEPGPSKASTVRSITIGTGLGKVRMDGTRGRSARAFGAVHMTGAGRLPVDTGFLRASLRVEVGSPNFVVIRPPGEDVLRVNMVSEAADRVNDALLAALAWNGIGTLWAAYTANYARPVEYGARGRAGTGFIRLATMQFPQVFREVCVEARTRSLSR